jgi:hypothetical protein
LTAEDGALHLTGGRKLTALSPAEFTSDSTTYRFDGKHLTVESADGSVLTYIRMPPWRPSASELASFTGTYRSDEALATYHVGVREGQLVMIPADRRGHAITLHALVMDTFQADDIGLVRFHPDSQKGFADLEMSNPRVYSLHFHRQVAHRESLLSH